jgi:hypothetical protein
MRGILEDWGGFIIGIKKLYAIWENKLQALTSLIVFLLGLLEIANINRSLISQMMPYYDNSIDFNCNFRSDNIYFK